MFKNVHEVNTEADSDPKTVRISVDTKATVHVGDYSRKGKSRFYYHQSRWQSGKESQVWAVFFFGWLLINALMVIII
ncbi:hypothetical protein [Desulfobacter postgatei]|uniref:hypothetical protein n=1 Tax=Desulfobacter postgatei TaxID=2293 RepID=UPI00338F6E66